MRNPIFRALVPGLLWLLRGVFPARGRHRVRSVRPAYVICGGCQVVTVESLRRTVRLRGEEVELIRPYAVAAERRRRALQAERRRAAAAAAVGEPDWPPYTYPGALLAPRRRGAFA
jgi:hypothetical protein